MEGGVDRWMSFRMVSRQDVIGCPALIHPKGPRGTAEKENCQNGPKVLIFSGRIGGFSWTVEVFQMLEL